MVIKNITDKNTPKVVGVGNIWLAPGEEKFFPDDRLYVSEVDRYGKATGKKIVLPAIQRQAELGMISYTEDKKPEKKEEVKADEPEEEAVAEENISGEPEEAVEEATAEEPVAPKKTTRKKKTATAE